MPESNHALYPFKRAIVPPESAFVNCLIVAYDHTGSGDAPSYSYWIVPGTYDDGEGNKDGGSQ